MTTTLRELPVNTVFPVNGVSFRQEAVHTMLEGDPVRIVHDVHNEHDPNACAIYTLDGTHLGFVPRRLAPRLATVRPGGEWQGKVTEVLRGDTWGLRITLTGRNQNHAGPPSALRHAGDGVVESPDGTVHVPDTIPEGMPHPPTPAVKRHVYAKSGRLLGVLIEQSADKVAVLSTKGVRALFPATVVVVK